ncbi:MAG: AarF/UbiB family protein, partial [Myxococcota bacterium]
MAEQDGRRRSRVPVGRVERVARIGWLAGEMALGAAAESVRRLAGSRRDAAGNPFVSGPNAERLARRLSGLRGAAMKLGQLLSMEAEDLLPGEVADALAVLRAHGDSMPAGQLRSVLVDAYGRDWEELFLEFDLEPIAAASIGQVHQAVASDGRQLALKIQYPGVAKSIDSDVDNLATALRLSHILPRDVDVSDLLAEVKRELHREVDYIREARNLQRYAELVARDREFAIPKVHTDLTTS